MPTAAELGVDVQPYLNGMAEAASELRRQVLDCLRRDEGAEAERLLGLMDDVYGMLVTVDYPDALTGGLRRSTDALRAVLERTRGDVTTAIVAARLQAAIERRTSDAERSPCPPNLGCVELGTVAEVVEDPLLPPRAQPAVTVASEATAEGTNRLLELPGTRSCYPGVVVAHVDPCLRGVAVDRGREVAEHVLSHDLGAADHLAGEAHDRGRAVRARSAGSPCP